MSTAFDFTPLVPAGIPAGAAKWTGLPKYNFTGGNNDSDELPLDGLIASAHSVLKREGRTLATYGLASGPQGYRGAARFPGRKAQARRRHDLHRRRYPRHLRLAPGARPGQRRAAGARRHRHHRAGVLPGLDQPSHPAWRHPGRHSARQRRHEDGRARRMRSTISSAAASARNTSTPSRPCRTRPAPSCRKPAAPRCCVSPRRTACRSSRTTAIAT